MVKPGTSLSLPESESNTPEDKKMGWKPWTSTTDRWWMGKQWGETYRERQEDAESI